MFVEQKNSFVIKNQIIYVFSVNFCYIPKWR
jgi:hypothetical protein